MQKFDGKTNVCLRRTSKMKGITKESLKTMLKYAWPSMIEYFFTALATIIDSKMVSGLGKEAVAAVGLTSQPGLLRLTVFSAINIATSALIARRRGEKRKDNANEILLTALSLTLVFTVLISVSFFVFANEMMVFFGSNGETHEMAVSYFRILSAGTIFTVLQNCINSAQRGAGNTKLAMKTHLTSSIVNICGNYLLIEGHFGFPRMEIRGAAIATIFGMFVACVISILSLFRKDAFLSLNYVIKEKLKPAWAEVKRIAKLGYSIFIEQILLRVGHAATAIMIAQQGTNALSANTVGANLMNLSFSIAQGVQAATVALVGKALGEMNREKAMSYSKTGMAIGFTVAAILATVYLTGTKYLYMIFFPNSPEVVDIGVTMAPLFAIIIIFQVMLTVNVGVLHAAGDTAFTAIVSILGTALARPLVAYFCGIYLDWMFAGIIGIWFGTLADMVLKFMATGLRMRTGKWMNIKI